MRNELYASKGPPQGGMLSTAEGCIMVVGNLNGFPDMPTAIGCLQKCFYQVEAPAPMAVFAKGEFKNMLFSIRIDIAKIL